MSQYNLTNFIPASLTLKWQNLPNTDKKIYGVLILLVSIVLIYTFIWLPSTHARERLQSSILEKQTKLSQMQAQSEQIKVLQHAIKLSHASAEGLQTAIETSAKLHGINTKMSPLQHPNPESVAVNFTSISFDEWISWISALQSEHQVRVSEAHVKALATSGMVQVDAILVAD